MATPQRIADYCLRVLALEGFAPDLEAEEKDERRHQAVIDPAATACWRQYRRAQPRAERTAGRI